MHEESPGIGYSRDTNRKMSLALNPRVLGIILTPWIFGSKTVTSKGQGRLQVGANVLELLVSSVVSVQEIEV